MDGIRERLQNKKRVVIKIGSSSLTHEITGNLNLQKLEKLVRTLCDLRNQGMEVVLVSSGAIAVGRKSLGLMERPKKISLKQACAAVGQANLMMIYQKLFAEYGQLSAQVLITKTTMVNELSRYNARNTVEDLLQLGVIPIVKENDTTYLVKLRQGVLWQDGSNFTQTDVHYTIDRIKSEGINTIYKDNLRYLAEYKEIDDYTFELVLSQPVPFFEYNLTFPIISSSLFAGEDIRNSDKNNFPIGTGRYKLKAINTSSQMELEENNNWWNKSTENLRINTITIRIYETIAEVYNGYKLRAD